LIPSESSGNKALRRGWDFGHPLWVRHLFFRTVVP